MSGDDSKSSKQRALEWAEDIRTRPLTDEQAIALASVYAVLASVEAQEDATRALVGLHTSAEALSAAVGRFLAYAALSGDFQAPGPSHSRVGADDGREGSWPVAEEPEEGGYEQ